MPYTLMQVGTGLKLMNTSGVLTSLTLPTGVTITASDYPRWTNFKDLVILAGSTSSPITIDRYGTTRMLSPKPPDSALTLTVTGVGGTSTSLVGAYSTFVIKDAQGNVVSESGYSPASAVYTQYATPTYWTFTGIPRSSESITARRLYRPLLNGTALFQCAELDGNDGTSLTSFLTDAQLSILAAPSLGTPPKLSLVKVWRDRLFGVGTTDISTLLYSEAEKIYSFPTSNYIDISGSGTDTFGIVGLVPRRDALGIGRRDAFFQLVGQTPNDWSVVKISENTGILSQESAVVYRDQAFWLWYDGVYQWNSYGIKCISDGKVRRWFTTDDYFNRALFYRAFAVIDPKRMKYRLHLASAGSTTIDSWVEYDLNTDTWWGPQSSTAFDPSCAFLLPDDNDNLQVALGNTDGYVRVEQTAPYDDTSTPIAFKVSTKFFNAGIPDYEKYWGQLSIVGKVQSSGALKVTPKLGYLDGPSLPPFNYDMAKGRERLRRIGMAKMFQLTFEHSATTENVELYGIEIDFHQVGHR